MRFGMSMKISLPDKRTVSGEKEDKNWEGSLGNLIGPSSLSLDQ